jgi:uncharacterized protein (TIGR02246 family)
MSRMTNRDLLAESEVRALVARYCHAIVERDDEAWADTFAKDAVWEVLGSTLHGRDAILAHYRKLVAGVPWVIQRATDGIVEVQGDTATGRWIVTEYLKTESGVSGMNVGVYRDEYRRCEDGRWRFARRAFTPSYLGPADLSGKPIQRPGSASR